MGIWEGSGETRQTGLGGLMDVAANNKRIKINIFIDYLYMIKQIPSHFNVDYLLAARKS
jgi:hypothetical protein